MPPADRDRSDRRSCWVDLRPHPYIEWFSVNKNHYRVELAPGDAWILSDTDAAELDRESEAIREALSSRFRSTRHREESDWV